MRYCLRFSFYITLFSMIIFCTTGCSTGTKVPAANSGDAFSDGYSSVYPDAFFHLQEDGLVRRLDYDSMQDMLLCNKPNCTHAEKDCAENCLNGKVPIFADNCAYYFVNAEQQFIQGKDGKTELQISTELCCFDFAKGEEKSLLQLSDCSVSANYGLLLHDHKLYFVSNALSRFYDENGMLVGVGGTGGEMHLFAVDLNDLSVSDLGSLYDVDALAEYYPLAVSSGEVYMKGLFDNKIYFNVGFVVELNGEETYQFYVAYYDLSDGSYHGTPDDYTQIDFASVRYVSDDYLVICQEGAASVYQKGSSEPIVLEHPYFGRDVFMFVSDDTVFCYDMAFDLNTRSARKLDHMNENLVITRYGDFFIYSDQSYMNNFEKIPAEKLLK